MKVGIAPREPLVSYAMPPTVEEALSLAQEYAGACEFIAGGTDSEIRRRLGLRRQPMIIDLSGIRELRRLDGSGGALNVGALVTLHELTVAPEVTGLFPMIAAAAASVATPVIRETATIGGNLLVSNRCTFYNQSQFWRNSIGSCLRDIGDTCLVTGIRNGQCFSRNVSDLAAALIAHNAEVVVQNSRGREQISLSSLYAMDGLRPVCGLDEHALLTGIHIGEPAKAWGFRKLRLRESLDFTSLTAAATLDRNGNFRICLNGIAMAPILVQGSMTELSLDETKRQLRLKAKPVNNDLLPLDYRKRMMDTYVEELWNELTSPERHP